MLEFVKIEHRETCPFHVQDAFLAQLVEQAADRFPGRADRAGEILVAHRKVDMQAAGRLRLAVFLGQFEQEQLSAV